MATPKTVADLKANAKNPRSIADHKLTTLKKTLAEFGDLGGIVFNRTTGHLVGGHQRAKALPPDAKVTITHTAAKPTKRGTVAEGVIVVNGESFKYREVAWDATREKAANLAANKSVGEWDVAGLGDWLRELDEEGIDLDLTGFDLVERAAFLDTKKANTAEEWEGMPEFAQENKLAFMTIALHFPDQASVDKFAKLLGQKIGPRTRTIWYPEIVIEHAANKRYVTKS